MAPTVELHVRTTGSDSNSGSVAQPLRTLDGARLAARKFAGEHVIVRFDSGVYRLKKPVQFSEKDSGDVTYEASPRASVVFCGSQAFKPQWSRYKGKILKCATPADFDTDQLFINGERQVLARYPNEDLAIRIFHGYAKDAISPERVARWSDPAGGFLHAMHAQMWGDFHYRILGKDDEGKLRLEGGWQNNRRMGMHDEYRFVEGIFEELDAPGEWYLNRKTRTLYYYPRPGMDLANCVVEGPRVSSLLEFQGAHGIKLRGFTFRHTLRTFMANREPLLRSDWTIYRGGAVHFKGSSDCVLEDCTLESLGGNAIFVDGKNRRLGIRGCRIENIGANGICFVGDPSAVRSPLFEYNERQSYQGIDKAPGPKSEEYPSDCLVEDCLIDRTGAVEKQTAGIEISMSRRITVRHCSIYQVPRAGINIGDGCWGGHLIEGCDVFDTVLETGDHGSFNSWGRDRYWGLTDLDMNLGIRPDLAALDTVEPIVIRNNRWRCDHGWDIDLDDGSSRYIIQNNLCLNGGIKNREGYGRDVENNIVVGNSFHPHVWFQHSGDIFRRNIVFTPYRPIGVTAPWGKEIDLNLLHVAGLQRPRPATELAQQSGRDPNSLAGDARFEDPVHGDYRVLPGSPALLLGFRNFPMNNFGVRIPALRAMARHPQFVPVIEGQSIPTHDTAWFGGRIKDLVDPGDVSATGSSANAGVLLAEAPLDSAAARMGLQSLDVIKEVDGTPVKSVEELVKIGRSHPRILTIWREQRIVTVRVTTK
jgi:hypothetical protein